MQHIDDRCEPLEQIFIAIPDFTKRQGLFSEYIMDRIGAIAAIDHVGEWVVTEIFPSFLGVIGQGSIKKRLEWSIGSRGHERCWTFWVEGEGE